MRWCVMQSMKYKKWILAVMNEDCTRYEVTDIMSDNPDQIVLYAEYMNEGKGENRIDSLTLARLEEFKKKYDMDISSEVISVEPTDSPWKVLFKVRVKADKDSEQFNGIVESNCSIEGLKDPLPYAKLPKIYYNINNDGNKIHYFEGL